MKRAWLLGALLLGSVQAAGIKLRPQGETLVQAVQAAIAQLSTKDVPMTLDATSGPTITVGGVGVSAAPFSPDAISRVVTVGGERRIELNPQVPLEGALRQTLLAELKLKEWTPAAAQQRFGGADLNADGVIDLTDLAILMANFGTASGAAGDLNQDRKVDDADLRVFSAQYSKAIAQPPPAAPATPAITPAPSGTAPAPGTGGPATPPSATPPAPPPGTPPAEPPADGTTAPGTTAPGITSPGITTPGTTSPGTTTPGTTSPGTGTPGTGTPAPTPAEPAPGTTTPPPSKP